MEFLIIGVALVIIVAIILFMPKKGSKKQAGPEKQKGSEAQKQAVKKQAETAKKKAVPAKKKSVKKPMKAGRKLQPDADFLNEDDEDGDFAGDNSLDLGIVNESEESNEQDFSVPVESAPTMDYSAPVESAPAADYNQNVPQTAENPEIKMDSEPVNHSTRVRKKVHEETKEIKSEQEKDPISFEGNGFENFDTPSIDDIFADPEINKDNYRDELFATTSEEELKANDVNGLKIVPEEVEQVSEDLEPIDAKKEEGNDEETEQVEDEEQQPVEDAEPAEPESGQAEPESGQSETETESESEPEFETDELEASTEQVEDESSSVETQQVPREEFIPGSVTFHNTGLKFRTRTNQDKVSNLLPAELPVNYDDDDVVLSIESPDVKAPAQKDGMIVLYNSHIYKNGKAHPWDVRYEAQLQNGEEVTVDTGVGIRVPHGFGIKLVPVDNMQTKFGLELASSENVSQREAAFSLKFTVRSTSVVSYIAKNQPLIYVKIFRI